MVFVADAIVEPRAMVVHLQNTPFAHTAMVRPQRLHGFAFLATIVILLKGYFVNVFRNNRSSPSDVQPEREREREIQPQQVSTMFATLYLLINATSRRLND